MREGTARKGALTVASSDGQHIHLGDGGEIAGSVNGHYGSDPITKLYTTISGRYAPFHTKIIAATASEAVHVLDALLETEAGAAVTRHHVDGGGVSDLVFALCHGLGFAFVPRIPDLDGRCLYGFAPARHYGVLQSVIGDRLDADLIRRHWDDALRLLTSLRTRTVSASLVLRQLSATPRQSGLAQTPMSLHERLDHWKLDLVVLADNLGRHVAGQRHPATRTFIRMMIDDPIDALAQAARTPLMARLGAARFGLLAALFPIGGRRL